MQKNDEYYRHRIIEILNESRKLNHRSVLDVCTYADLGSRRAYYNIINGKCKCLTTLIILGLSAGVLDYNWPEYFDCCIKWIGITG